VNKEEVANLLFFARKKMYIVYIHIFCIIVDTFGLKIGLIPQK